MNDTSTLVSEKSTHQVPVVEVKLEPHPNADLLSIVKVFDYTCVVKTDQWKDGDLGAWVPPDSIVDISSPTFSFLPKKVVKAKKIRGIVSYGLLVPAPAGFACGESCTEALNVTHYDPIEAKIQNPQSKKESIFCEEMESPPGVYPKYDVDAFLKFGRKVLEEGQQVVYTEKIHGENSRYVFANGKMFCGSRTTWKREVQKLKYTREELIVKLGDPDKVDKIIARVADPKTAKNKWWKMLDKYPGIKTFCEQNPGHCIYGELYGDVKEMKYGHVNGENSLAVFDILDPKGTFYSFSEFKTICEAYGLPMVPIICEAEFNFDHAVSLMSGPSVISNAKHIREGVVVKPIKEVWNDRYGRVCLKLVSPEYYEGDYQAFHKG